MAMDENKSRQSPGMTDNQSGQSRNMFAIPEAEEVSKSFNNVFEALKKLKFEFN